MPPTFSGAPPSSLLMWAVDAAITAPQPGSIDCSAVTFAPVPLKTGKTSTGFPKWPANTSRSRPVTVSAPYAGS